MRPTASAKLFQSCCTGHHHASAQVYLRKAGGNDVKQGDFLTYDFKDVSIDSVQWSGASGGDGVPTESLSFSFDQVKIKYFPQDAKGKLATTPVQAGWDLSKNVAV